MNLADFIITFDFGEPVESITFELIDLEEDYG